MQPQASATSRALGVHELLGGICQQLPGCDLKNLRLVNALWHAAAGQVLFRSLWSDISQTDSLKLDNVAHSSHAKLVRKLILEFPARQQFEPVRARREEREGFNVNFTGIEARLLRSLRRFDNLQYVEMGGNPWCNHFGVWQQVWPTLATVLAHVAQRAFKAGAHRKTQKPVTSLLIQFPNFPAVDKIFSRLDSDQFQHLVSSMRSLVVSTMGYAEGNGNRRFCHSQLFDRLANLDLQSIEVLHFTFCEPEKSFTTIATPVFNSLRELRLESFHLSASGLVTAIGASVETLSIISLSKVQLVSGTYEEIFETLTEASLLNDVTIEACTYLGSDHSFGSHHWFTLCTPRRADLHALRDVLQKEVTIVTGQRQVCAVLEFQRCERSWVRHLVSLKDYRASNGHACWGKSESGTVLTAQIRERLRMNSLAKCQCLQSNKLIHDVQ